MSRKPPTPLSASANRALSSIIRGISEGLSDNTIQRTLQDEGLGYRRTDMLSDIRTLRGVETSSARLRTLPPDRHADPSRMPYALTQQLREYSFRVRVSGFDPNVGQRVDRFINVSTNELLTRTEIEDIASGFAEDMSGENASGGLLEIDEVALEGGTRRR